MKRRRRPLTPHQRALEGLAQALVNLPQAERLGQAVADRARLNRALRELAAWRDQHRGHPEFLEEFGEVDRAIAAVIRAALEGGRE